MNAKEALLELKTVLKTNPETKQYGDIFEEHLIAPIEKELNMLDLLRNALTLEVLPIEYGNIKEEHPDGSWSYAIKQTCNFVAHKLDEEYKKELTKWIIDNIDKDTVRKWLEEDNVK